MTIQIGDTVACKGWPGSDLLISGELVAVSSDGIATMRCDTEMGECDLLVAAAALRRVEIETVTTDAF